MQNDHYVHALRNLALKLNPNGTAEVLEEQKLYQGSYGFIKLQVYVPVTPNSEERGMLCYAYCQATDTAGRTLKRSKNYTLLYVQECVIGDGKYMLFERLLPQAFTEVQTTPCGLSITITFMDTKAKLTEDGSGVIDDNDVRIMQASDILISSKYTTTVSAGGWTNDGLELDTDDSLVAQVNDNTQSIEELSADFTELQSLYEANFGGMVSEKDRAMAAEQALSNRLDDTNNVKMDKRTSATEGNFVAFDGNGNSKDSGYSKTNIENAQKTAETGVANAAKAQAAADKAQGAADTAQGAADRAQQTADDAMRVALARDTSQVFATKEEMDAWLAIPENVASLVTGSSLFIEDAETPDYWWTGSRAEEYHDKTDLTPYYKGEKVEQRIKDSLGPYYTGAQIEQKLTDTASETKSDIVKTYSLDDVVISPDSEIERLVPIAKQAFDELAKKDEKTIYVVQEDDDISERIAALEDRVSELEMAVETINNILGGLLQ